MFVSSSKPPSAPKCENYFHCETCSADDDNDNIHDSAWNFYWPSRFGLSLEMEVRSPESAANSFADILWILPVVSVVSHLEALLATSDKIW